MTYTPRPGMGCVSLPLRLRPYPPAPARLPNYGAHLRGAMATRNTLHPLCAWSCVSVSSMHAGFKLSVCATEG